MPVDKQRTGCCLPITQKHWYNNLHYKPVSTEDNTGLFKTMGGDVYYGTDNFKAGDEQDIAAICETSFFSISCLPGECKHQT
jgi:hypothetical protein